jgi:hypothetical protein
VDVPFNVVEHAVVSGPDEMVDAVYLLDLPRMEDAEEHGQHFWTVQSRFWVVVAKQILEDFESIEGAEEPDPLRGA